jgi:hypothetical protein
MFKNVITPHIVRLSHPNISKETSYIVPFQTDSIVLKVTEIFLTKYTWLDIISNWRFVLNYLFVRKY